MATRSTRRDPLIQSLERGVNEAIERASLKATRTRAAGTDVPDTSPTTPTSTATATGGHTTTTPAGIAHVPPGGQAPAAIVAELLTTKQAAEMAGCGERTWWAWSRSGLAPRPLQIGFGTRPACRYRRSEILAWIQSGCPRVDGKGDNQR
jgi:predicted DNA-binding transcriptional regulator AlpA